MSILKKSGPRNVKSIADFCCSTLLSLVAFEMTVFAPYVPQEFNKMTTFQLPTNDVVFKLLFSKPENSELLISFLTAVLKPARPIQSVQILNPELPKDTAVNKTIILDVMAKLSDGSKIDVEMQVDDRKNLRKRIPFYLARLHQSQLDPGDPYHKITPTVSIVILAYNETPEENFHTIYELREQNSHLLFSDDLKIHLIELLKVSDFLKKHASAQTQDVIFWTRFFNSKTQSELDNLAMEKPIFEKANQALKAISNDPETLEVIRMRELGRVNFNTAMYGAREEGREEGRQEGIEKNRQEVVLNMHADGMNATQIARILKIDAGVVEKIISPP